MCPDVEQDELTRRLVHPNGPYTDIEVVDSTGSTNADLLARTGVADRTVLIAREQTAGEGRRGRSWVSPAGGLYMSVYYAPALPPARLPWMTLLAGVALVKVARSVGVDAVLKWPNDLLLGPDQRKGAGVLASIGGSGVVLGLGLNVAALPDDIPLGAGGLQATSLEDEGANELDRTELAARLLTELAALEGPWRAAGGDPFASGLHEEYRKYSGTLGQEVRVELSGDVELMGTARYLETDGTLVVRDAEGHEHSVPAGDVIHLRQVS
jgi:BirA family biotin operon repressor/biotin-[acetyl-CoA-carboxylase] ligase